MPNSEMLQKSGKDCPYFLGKGEKDIVYTKKNQNDFHGKDECSEQ